jgi:hypothetical protein
VFTDLVERLPFFCKVPKSLYIASSEPSLISDLYFLGVPDVPTIPYMLQDMIGYYCSDIVITAQSDLGILEGGLPEAADAHRASRRETWVRCTGTSNGGNS